jgi:DHA2 family multidrug resistance protein
MNAVSTTNAIPAPSLTGMPAAVLTALAGSFLSNLTGQFVGTNLADIQGGIGSSADEASWISTVFQVASAVGIIVSPPLTRALGLRRYLTWSTVVFAACAWICAIAGTLPTLLFARAVQGFAAGGFGPIAFTAIFMMLKGPRLAFGLSLLAFVLISAVNVGPVISAPIEAAFGWRGLFVAQFIASMVLLMASFRGMPPSAPFDRAPF